MKKLLSISLIFTTILLANFAKANDIEISVRVMKENSKFVSFAVNEKNSIQLSLYTADGDLVYEQQLNTYGVKMQKYDLRALPEGSYVLKMEAEGSSMSCEIELTDEGAVVGLPVVKEIKSPIVKRKDELVWLDLNGACKGDVEVKIYNEFNTELLEENYNAEAKAIRKYDVSLTPYKQLTFVIKSAGQEFVETITL